MDKLPIVDDFMDKVFTTFRPDTGIHEAIRTLMKERLTGALVVDEHKMLLGVLSENECMRVLMDGGFFQIPEGTVLNYMQKHVETTDRNADIITVAQRFLSGQFRRIAVVENNRVVGQITTRDILRGMEAYYEKL
jgi:predicted transcriptional regulator